MDRYRTTATIVFIFVYLFAFYPWQAIIIATLVVLAFLISNDIRPLNMIERNAREDRRKMALKSASMFLAPYKNIWGSLKLSNKYCSLRLGTRGVSITARDSLDQNRSFRVAESKVHSFNDLWDMYCMNFSHNTTFDELVQLSNMFNAVLIISDNKAEQQKSKSQDNNLNSVTNQKNNSEKKELLDVNNASEVELTALPGVSIVMAKKLIKKREEIDGFKSVSDVCLFLKLKPHMQSQLESLICVKKMKGSIQIKRYEERSIDL